VPKIKLNSITSRQPSGFVGFPNIQKFAIPKIAGYIINAQYSYSADNPYYRVGAEHPLYDANGNLLGATQWPPMFTDVSQTAFAFGEALTDFKAYTVSAGVAERFELSAMNMLTHVILDENVVVNSALLEELTAVTAKRRRELKEQTANIDAFEERIKTLFTGVNEGAPVKISSNGSIQRDAYWTRVRGDLQRWFCMGLADLADMIGVAKATLVYIDRPGRRPRPSTARKVMDLHAIGSGVVKAWGADRGRDWLSTVGLAQLRDGGVAALDRLVTTTVYGIRKSEESIPYDKQEQDYDTQPFAPTSQTEAEAF
jgi:hypothetical protein